MHSKVEAQPQEGLASPDVSASDEPEDFPDGDLDGLAALDALDAEDFPLPIEPIDADDADEDFPFFDEAEATPDEHATVETAFDDPLAGDVSDANEDAAQVEPKPAVDEPKDEKSGAADDSGPRS